MASRTRDPRTKEELLDRMLSFDFDGDIRHLGVEPATVVRQAANKLILRFPHSGKEFELAVHIRRDEPAAPNQRPAESRSFAGQPEDEREWQAASPDDKKKGIRPRPRTQEQPRR